ncbi:MAG: CHAT domain-containing protein, partial [Planctomycetes bacterium]|nr:CHAT domain-containing protein [Planctomycetota bacterium]
RIGDERGDVLRAKGDANGARASYEGALAALDGEASAADAERAAAAERVRANILADLGSLRAERGDLRGAHRAFLHAARAARGLGDADEIARALANLGNLALRQGNAPRALAEFRLALQAHREGKRRDPSREAVFLEDVGLALGEIGEREQALASYRKALDVLAGAEGREADRARARNGLKVAALLRDGDRARAREQCESAREILERIGDRGLLAAAVNNLGNLRADAGEHEEAVALFRRSLALRDPAADPLGRAICLSNLGESLLELGRRDEARAAVDEALGLLEERRGAAATREDRDYFLKGKGAFHETAVRAALAGGRDAAAIEAAFIYAERAKARALLDLLAERDAEADHPSAASEPVRTATVEEVRARLAPGEVLLEYVIGDRGSWLFAVRRDGAEVHDLPDRRALRALIEPLIGMLRAPGSRREDLDRARIRTAEVLLGPVARMLARSERLAIVPDDILHRLPFDVLPLPGETSGAPDDLIERLSIRYAPSATVLRDLAMRRRDLRPARVLVLADPAYGEGAPRAEARGGGESTLLASLDALLRESQDILAGPFARLPGTAEEARAISSFFPDGAVRVISGRDATEEAMEDAANLRGATILHIAAHAFVLEREPLGSSIALAPGARDDGLVEVREIYALPLEADLVVLSACRSGGGEIAGGEGVLGFARAFLYAGASDVLVSLWSVHDRASAALIPAFYEALARAGADPAEALRAAKLAYLRDGYRRVRDAMERGLPVVRRGDVDARHPYYWAPFVLIGAATSRVSEAREEGKKP